MDHSKALEKIKKLLRLAASDNPHEAAAAMRQARALMEKVSFRRIGYPAIRSVRMCRP
jgi:hypothetical protein